MSSIARLEAFLTEAYCGVLVARSSRTLACWAMYRIAQQADDRE
jgi:hypothetical protein